MFRAAQCDVGCGTVVSHLAEHLSSVSAVYSAAPQTQVVIETDEHDIILVSTLITNLE